MTDARPVRTVEARDGKDVPPDATDATGAAWAVSGEASAARRLDGAEAPPISAAARMRHRILLMLIIALGVALHLPSLRLGFYADDNIHRLVLRGELEGGPMGPWSLYDFGGLDDWRGVEGVADAFPWWTSPDWSARFLRPLSSLSLRLDHLVFGAWVPGHHLTSLALFALLLAAAHALYRRLGLPPAACLAGVLLLALSDSAVLPVGWIANRNSLLEALLATSAVALAAPASRPPGAARVAGAIALAAAAALSKESGVAALLFVGLLFHRAAGPDGAGPGAGGAAALARAAAGGAAALARAARGRRLAAAGAAAAFALAAAHVLALVLGGYGTRSLYYATPWLQPGAFLANLAGLVASAPATFLGPFPTDAAGAMPEARWAVAAAGLVLGVPLVVWIARRVRGRPGTGWLLAWTIAFLVPGAATAPADRHLFVPMVGAAGILGLFFVELARRARSGAQPSGRARGAESALGVLLLVSATAGSAAYLLFQETSLAAAAGQLRAAAREAQIGSPEIGRREVFVLQSESQMEAFCLTGALAVERGDRDLHLHLLQGGRRAVRWTRTGERAFELETLDEPFLDGIFERVYRASEALPPEGTVIRSCAFTVEIVSAGEDGVRRIRVRLPWSLDDSRVRFLRPLDGRPAAISPPPVGESVVLPRAKKRIPLLP